MPTPTALLAKENVTVSGFGLRQRHFVIIKSVAADSFEGNDSAALRYIIDEWNKLKYQQQHGLLDERKKANA